MTAALEYDVVVLGGGNAGLCAALTARQAGRSVVVVERAPRHFRGGNSRHTRNFRCVHEASTALLPDSYSEDEFFSDLLRVNKNETDEALARLVVRQSADCTRWMGQFGVRFQSSLRGTLHLARTNAFFLGGGKAVMNSYYAAAARMGIDVLYDAEVVGLDVAEGIFRSVRLQPDQGDRSVRLEPDQGDRSVRLPAYAEGSGEASRSALLRARRLQPDQLTVRGGAAVIATGGFESNLAWLKEAWGDAADNFIVRGTPFNTGTPLRLMLDAGAQPVGDARACHAIAVDARAPKFDGGIVTRLDCLPLGIVVNRQGERFADEGEDLWPKRYASWGSLLAGQPEQTAFCIIDSKTSGLFMPSVFPPIVANSIRELALRLGVSPDGLDATVTAFNNAVRPGSFNLAQLDDCRTMGLPIDKTHWAQRLDTPPFWGYPLRPGITFTYLGLKVDETGRVLMSSGAPARNIYAAGEIMAGNILRQGYIAGIGMTIGTVFGRIAGKGAAQHAGW